MYERQLNFMKTSYIQKKKAAFETKSTPPRTRSMQKNFAFLPSFARLLFIMTKKRRIKLSILNNALKNNNFFHFFLRKRLEKPQAICYNNHNEKSPMTFSLAKL